MTQVMKVQRSYSLQLGNRSSPGGGDKAEMLAQEGSSGGVDSVTDGASDRNGRIADCSHNGDHDLSLAYTLDLPVPSSSETAVRVCARTPKKVRTWHCYTIDSREHLWLYVFEQG